MLKNNCQCDLCKSVWGAGARGGKPVTVGEVNVSVEGTRRIHSKDLTTAQFTYPYPERIRGLV